MDGALYIVAEGSNCSVGRSSGSVSEIYRNVLVSNLTTGYVKISPNTSMIRGFSKTTIFHSLQISHKPESSHFYEAVVEMPHSAENEKHIIMKLYKSC